MAKARQALSLWRGRAGGIVYSVKNGQQIISAAASKTTNPKTTSQVLQRMKLAPAQNFYRQLEGLVDLGFISHTFQGRKYGNANRRRFLQLAMLNNQGPYVPKDTLAFIPFDYQISEGSLPSFTGRVRIEGNAYNPIPAKAGEIGSGWSFEPGNIEKIANAFGCEFGDQLSVFYVSYANGNYIPKVARVVFDNSLADKSMREVFGDDYYDSFRFYVANDDLEIWDNPWGSVYLFVDGVAGACIFSRRQANGQYLRSTEFLAISDDIRDEYYTPEALQAALDSYNGTDTNTVSDPYYNNNAGTQAFDGKIYLSAMPYSYTVNGNKKTGRASVFWGLTSSGNKVIFTQTGTPSGGLITLNDHGATVICRTPEGEPVLVTNLTNATAWAGIVEWASGMDEQWSSGQKAVRPIMPSGAIDSPLLRTLYDLGFSPAMPITVHPEETVQQAGRDTKFQGVAIITGWKYDVITKGFERACTFITDGSAADDDVCALTDEAVPGGAQIKSVISSGFPLNSVVPTYILHFKFEDDEFNALYLYIGRPVVWSDDFIGESLDFNGQLPTLWQLAFSEGMQANRQTGIATIADGSLKVSDTDSSAVWYAFGATEDDFCVIFRYNGGSHAADLTFTDGICTAVSQGMTVNPWPSRGSDVEIDDETFEYLASIYTTANNAIGAPQTLNLADYDL